MKINWAAVLFSGICALCGFGDVEAAPQVPNQDEQECLNSERSNFKTSDVFFIANLGDRGLGVKPDQYWVRYKTKNLYGANIQGNMACKKNQATGKWQYDPQLTYFAEIIIAKNVFTIS